MTVGIGLIGAGTIGALHGQLIASRVPDAELVAAADPAEAVLSALASDLGAKDYQQASELLADPSVEAVIVATPPDTHCGLIKEAIAAGKHVFCEKPIGLDLAEIDETLAEVKRSSVKLQIGFNRRFDATFARARAMVASGEIGSPLSVHVVSWDPVNQRPQGRSDGDIFFDTTIHDLDMVRFVLGGEPVSVYVQGGVMAKEQLDDPDTVVTMLQFENGVTAVIDNSRISSHGYDQRLEVFGSGGLVTVANEQPHRATFRRGSGVMSAGPRPSFAERYTESYVEELRSFVDCVQGDGEPAVTGWDGRQAVAMARACLRSYQESRLVAMSEISGD